jgi:hypothetical protein
MTEGTETLAVEVAGGVIVALHSVETPKRF